VTVTGAVAAAVVTASGARLAPTSRRYEGGLTAALVSQVSVSAATWRSPGPEPAQTCANSIGIVAAEGGGF
jgi:hypothetical protein